MKRFTWTKGDCGEVIGRRADGYTVQILPRLGWFLAIHHGRHSSSHRSLAAARRYARECSE